MGLWDWRLFSLFHFEFLVGVALFQYRSLLDRFNGIALVVLGLLGFPATQYASIHGLACGGSPASD
jgi:hypothetical protein